MSEKEGVMKILKSGQSSRPMSGEIRKGDIFKSKKIQPLHIADLAEVTTGAAETKEGLLEEAT
jgi:hypothetical protein